MTLAGYHTQVALAEDSRELLMQAGSGGVLKYLPARGTQGRHSTKVVLVLPSLRVLCPGSWHCLAGVQSHVSLEEHASFHTPLGFCPI